MKSIFSFENYQVTRTTVGRFATGSCHLSGSAAGRVEADVRCDTSNRSRACLREFAYNGWVGSQRALPFQLRIAVLGGWLHREQAEVIVINHRVIRLDRSHLDETGAGCRPRAVAIA